MKFFEYFLLSRTFLSLFWLFLLLVFSLYFTPPTFAQPTTNPVLLYQANPPTYTGTYVSQQSFNNRNPYRFEVYNCDTFDGVNTVSVADSCSQTTTTINGEKWWSPNVSVNNVTCRVLQPGYDGPYHNRDLRITNGRPNATTQICPATAGTRGPNPFINVSVPFFYNPPMCQNGNALVLTSRPDPLNPECRDITLDDISANPANYSQSERSCSMYVDDEVEITACRNSSCQSYSIITPLDLTRVNTINYTNLCSIFNQGVGNYTVSLRAYDTGRTMYGSSSFYLTSLTWGTSYSVSGNVYNDTNKNRLKENSENNYNGPITISAANSSGGNAGTVTTNNGTFTVSGLNPGTYTVSYSSLPNGYSMVYPQTGPPPSFQFTVGPLGCSTNGALGASCNNGSITNLNFGITNSIPWIQAYDMDMRFDNGYSNSIPAAPQYPAYGIAQSLMAANPGILFSGDGTANFGQGQASSTNWVVGGTIYPEVFNNTNTPRLQTAYQSLLERATRGNITPSNLTTFPGCTNLANCTLPPDLPNGIYRANGNLTLNAFTASTARNYIFLINGNLTINGNIVIPNGSVALFAAAQNIVIPTTIGVPATFPLPSAQIQGFYSAGEDFIIQGNNNCLSGADRMLNAAGAIIVNANGQGGTFTNQRDLCGDNPRYPTFTIQTRPDFILNSPSFLMKQQVSYQEQAP